MISLYIFLSEICLSLTTSLFTLLLLRGSLHGVLTDLCQSTQRAEFWTSFTKLMLIIGPLLSTLLFRPSSGYPDYYSVIIFRETLRHALMGGFITLSGMGFVIWKTIPRRNTTTHQETNNLQPASNSRG